jgi:signal transduction histidine kinase/DNA-binding response OmpR family regulator/ligand-binding sensor domain-containing protein
MNKFLLILIGIFTWQLINAKQIRFDRYDISSGLSQNNINGLEFDERGNLWVGTLDGLNRFNGYSFDVIKPGRDIRGNLSSNHIVALGKGFNGNMWMVTRDGNLNFYDASQNSYSVIDNSTFEQFNLSATSNLCQASDSVLIFSYNNILGIWKIGGSNFQTLQTTGNIRGVKLIGQKLIVFGSFGIKEIAFENNTYAFKTISTVQCNGIDTHQQQKYALTTAGIIKLDEQFKFTATIIDSVSIVSNIPNLQFINDFLFDGETFWLGGYDLLGCFSPDKTGFIFTRYQNDQKINHSFKGHTVNKLRIDQTGNIWIGTFKNGLSLVNRMKNQFIYHEWDAQKLSDAESNPVRAICKTRNGELWVGFDRNGVGLIDKNGQQTFYSEYYTKTGQKRAITNVRIIFEDSDGHLWIGEENNLCHINRKTNRIETIDHFFDFSWPYRCYTIKEFEPGMVTLTSPNRIGFVNLKNKTLNTIQTQNIEGNIRDIAQDKYRNLWIIKNDNGLVKITYPSLNNELISRENNQLSDNKAYCLLVTGDSLWVGTNSGLNLIDIKTNRVIKQFFEEDGLCNNIVYSLYNDRNGDVWMSTNRGISRFSNTENRFRTYLPGDFFMDDAYFMDPNGIIYYGGYTGVVSFHPQLIQENNVVTKPVIESLTIYNQQVYPGDTIDGYVVLTRPVWLSQSLKLRYNLNTFGFSFNAYPFQIPNSNRFRYRMQGLYDHWIETTDIRSANFTKVPPGEYLFQVQVASDQTNYESISELKISIIPPFWLTAWFKALLVIAAAFVIFWGFRARVNQIKKRNQWLKNKVDEQTTELREQNRTIIKMSEELQEVNESKLRFFTNISHEFRTPLTIILGHIENLENQSKSAVNAIQKNAMRLLRLIDQVIDIRKMDQQQLSLSYSRFDLAGFVNDIIQSIEVMASRKKISIELQSQIPLISVCLDMDKMEKIIFNLLSNAIKFTPQGKQIVVGLNETDNEVTLSVIDEGTGIAPNELQHIFDRFYRGENTKHSTPGYGIGLALVYGLVQLQKGSIEVESTLDVGTCFKITLPKNTSHGCHEQIVKTSMGFEMYDTVHEQQTLNSGVLSGKKLLIVEDNIELLEYLTDILGKYFHIVTANNGKEALNKMDDFYPDLIISDIMMPVMDGITFCQKVKSALATSHIPFVLLTAKTNIENKIEGFELGIDDFIEKPFNSKLLLSRIEALLTNRQKLIAQYSNSAHNTPTTHHLSENDRLFLQQIDEAIFQNLGNSNFSIEQLSEKLNMSRASLYRKFSDLTGCSPADYVRKVRLRNAYQLLKANKLSIIEIAEKSGFQNVSYFRKSFKNEFGKTPSEAQKLN